MTISSLQNPQVKRMVRLRQARERRSSGCTRVDGARELHRALDAGLSPSLLFVCEAKIRTEEARQAIERAASVGATLQPVTAAVYEKLQFGDRDEGLAAILEWSPRPLDKLTLGPAPLVLLLDGIEKPGNLGAILRSADGAGVDAVLLVDPALDATNPNAIRASLGTIFTVPLAVASVDQARTFIASSQLTLYAAIAQDSETYSEVRYAERTALLLGSEHEGLNAGWRQDADHLVHIPLRGAADSLNVSTAAAVLLFEILRQRSL